MIAVIKKNINRKLNPYTYSEEAYLNYLREKHVLLGENVIIWSPKTTNIDVTKPYLIRIGDYVKITQGVTILAHDYSHSVLRRKFGEFRGGTKPVTIGNNVFIGMNTTILMGTTIGDDCIIGANSLLRGEYPAGSVIAGNPAKIICSVNEMWDKVTANWIDDAVTTARAIYENKGRQVPTIEEMSDAYVWMYLPRTDEYIEKYKRFFDLTCDDFEDIKRIFLESEPIFKSYEEFLEYCDFENTIKETNK